MKVEEVHREVEKTKDTGTFLKHHKIDIVFGGFLVALVLLYNFYISAIHVPIGDDAVYLTNARNWLSGEPLSEEFRPPLISWLIAGIWTVSGENWEVAKYLQPFFTIGSGILLYLTLKRYKGALFALGVTSLTMLNAELFFYSTRILTEGLSLFFVIATLYFLKTERRNDWFLAGVMIGLTFASRYPIILPALIIFVVESLIRKDMKLVSRTLIGAIPVIAIVIAVMFLKTETFDMALEKDTNFGFLLSNFYIVNSINIWGIAFLLVPVALLFRRTYSDKYNYTFIAWFVASLLFWSANATNHEPRFTIQFMPAVYHLAILAIENIARARISVSSFASRFPSSVKSSAKEKQHAIQRGD